jgi:hypothetical protein
MRHQPDLLVWIAIFSLLLAIFLPIYKKIATLGYGWIFPLLAGLCFLILVISGITGWIKKSRRTFKTAWAIDPENGQRYWLVNTDCNPKTSQRYDNVEQVVDDLLTSPKTSFAPKEIIGGKKPLTINDKVAIKAALETGDSVTILFEKI